MPESNTESIIELLFEWLAKRLDSAASEWIQMKCSAVQSGNLRDLYLAFGFVSRKLPKTELALSTQELEQADAVRLGWRPELWSVQDVARTLLILQYDPGSEDQFVTVLDRLFAAGEVHELIALYQAIPLLPYPERHTDRAGEGIRTNMQSVFRAIAHRNSYPSEQLSDGMWNQMVLKCLFVGAPLYPVLGLDLRVNAELSQMLCDYAHERWAASRTVHPELWRCVRPELTPGALDDLKRVVEQGSELEKQAVALSLFSSSDTAARDLLETLPELRKQIEQGALSWETVYLSLDRE